MDRKEWLKSRQQGIGSSDAAAVLGISPYMNILELYESKVGEIKDEKGNFITDQGNRFEPMIRKLIEDRNFETYEPALAVHKDFPQLMASLDGQSPDKETIIEIKIMGKEPWERARDDKEIPPHYLAQIRHQLGVTGAKRCLFVAHLYEKGMSAVSQERLVVIEVLPDSQAIFEQMKKVLDFWASHVVPKIPPKVEPEYKPLPKTTALTEAFESWKSLTKQATILDGKIQNARDVMLKAAKDSGHKKAAIEDVRIREEYRKGSIDYKKIPAIANMTEKEFEQYRGKGAYTWKVELTNTKREKKAEKSESSESKTDS